jgi:hypothetical protein
MRALSLPPPPPPHSCVCVSSLPPPPPQMRTCTALLTRGALRLDESVLRESIALAESSSIHAHEVARAHQLLSLIAALQQAVATQNLPALRAHSRLAATLVSDPLTLTAPLLQEAARVEQKVAKFWKDVEEVLMAAPFSTSSLEQWSGPAAAGLKQAEGVLRQLRDPELQRYAHDDRVKTLVLKVQSTRDDVHRITLDCHEAFEKGDLGGVASAWRRAQAISMLLVSLKFLLKPLFRDTFPRLAKLCKLYIGTGARRQLRDRAKSAGGGALSVGSP